MSDLAREIGRDDAPEVGDMSALVVDRRGSSSTSTMPHVRDHRGEHRRGDVRRCAHSRRACGCDHFADLLRNGDDSSGDVLTPEQFAALMSRLRHRAGDDGRLVRRPAQLVRHPRFLDDGLLPAPGASATCSRAAASGGSPKEAGRCPGQSRRRGSGLSGTRIARHARTARPGRRSRDAIGDDGIA